MSSSLRYNISSVSCLKSNIIETLVTKFNLYEKSCSPSLCLVAIRDCQVIRKVKVHIYSPDIPLKSAIQRLWSLPIIKSLSKLVV